MRKYFQRRLPSDPSKDYYFILRDTANNQAALIEYGFLDSTGDDVDQIKNNWQDYAEAVVRAVTIYIGKTYIPKDTSGYYTVQKGDSLWSIAKKFNISVEELKSINNLSSNLLSIGQVLKIPTKEIEETVPSGQELIYIVKAGDTLYSIASKNNVSVNDLINANSLSGSALSVGQQILIPKIISDNLYIVKAGDSLYSIAREKQTNVDELKRLNNLTSNALSIGQQLIIPTIPPAVSDTELTHLVSAGDTLYSVANKYGILVDELKSANNLSSNTLSIGQKLIIPQTSEYKTYTIKTGDTLYSIAREFNTTVNKIKEINNLVTNTLSIGQKLLIP